MQFRAFCDQFQECVSKKRWVKSFVTRVFIDFFSGCGNLNTWNLIIANKKCRDENKITWHVNFLFSATIQFPDLSQQNFANNVYSVRTREKIRRPDVTGAKKKTHLKRWFFSPLLRLFRPFHLRGKMLTYFVTQPHKGDWRFFEMKKIVIVLF